MALEIKSGFYDSVDGDRKYSAVDFSKMFDGLITNGVFSHVGTMFELNVLGDDIGIQVSSGRAWACGRWAYVEHDTIIPGTKKADLFRITNPSIDDRKAAIIIKIDWNNDERKSTIEAVNYESIKDVIESQKREEGIDTRKYYILPLAVLNLKTQKLTSMVGTSMCPYVTGILKQVDIDKHLNTFNFIFLDFLKEMKERMSSIETGKIANDISILVDAIANKVDSNDAIFSGIPKWVNPIEGDVTVPRKNWIKDGDLLKCNILIEGINEKHSILVSPKKENEEECSKYGIVSEIIVKNGSIDIFSRQRPSKDIVLRYRVVI